MRNITENHGRRKGEKIVTNREGGRQTITDLNTDNKLRVGWSGARRRGENG